MPLASNDINGLRARRCLQLAGFLTNGNYSFPSGLPITQSFELQPSTGVLGTTVMNVASVDYSYRGWQMPSLYNPPAL